VVSGCDRVPTKVYNPAANKGNIIHFGVSGSFLRANTNEKIAPAATAAASSIGPIIKSGKREYKKPNKNGKLTVNQDRSLTVDNIIPESKKKLANMIDAAIAPILKFQPIQPTARPTKGRIIEEIRKNVPKQLLVWSVIRVPSLFKNYSICPPNAPPSPTRS
jgi:hypothetical protein